MEAIASFYDNKVHLLGALPECWSKGHIKNFRLPGGHLLNFAWEKGVLTCLDITVGYGETVTIAVCKGIDKEITVKGKPGEKITVLSKDN